MSILADHALLLRFIGSLTLADNMSDVAEDIQFVLKEIGLGDLEWDDLGDLADKLGAKGVTTLYGTPLLDSDDEEEEEV